MTTQSLSNFCIELRAAGAVTGPRACIVDHIMVHHNHTIDAILQKVYISLRLKLSEDKNLITHHIGVSEQVWKFWIGMLSFPIVLYI